MRQAICHPERKHEAKGLCQQCYRGAMERTAKYKAMRVRYRKTPAGIAGDKLYRQSPAGKIVSAKASRKAELKRRYGMMLVDYDAMLISQGGGCALCGARNNKSGKRLVVDHHHGLGKNRGILCDKCNRGIGLLGDDVALLHKAIAYLEKYDE